MKKTVITSIIALTASFLFGCEALAASPAAGNSGTVRPTARERMIRDYRIVDNAVKKFFRDGVDTNYVDIPNTSWEIPVTALVYGENLSIAPLGSPITLENGCYFEMGAGIGYHGLDAVYTTSVGSKMDFNFRFDFYDNYYGVGIEISKNRYGREIYGEPLSNDGATELATRRIMLDGYFAFNGKRFSLASVLYGNYIQKKSAGSPIIAGWYQNLSMTPYTRDASQLLGMLSLNQMNTGALIGGYGYNLAFMEGKLVVCFLAGVGVTLPYCGLASMGRICALYWINDHIRINAGINNFYQQSPNEKELRYDHNIWRANFTFAYCF